MPTRLLRRPLAWVVVTAATAYGLSWFRHRLEPVGLGTSNGPDLQVGLTDQPVHTGPSGWHISADGPQCRAGFAQGQPGRPGVRDAGLTGLTSVAIWCERFAVPFGAAPLTAAG